MESLAKMVIVIILITMSPILAILLGLSYILAKRYFKTLAALIILVPISIVISFYLAINLIRYFGQ